MPLTQAARLRESRTTVRTRERLSDPECGSLAEQVLFFSKGETLNPFSFGKFSEFWDAAHSLRPQRVRACLAAARLSRSGVLSEYSHSCFVQFIQFGPFGLWSLRNGLGHEVIAPSTDLWCMGA